MGTAGRALKATARIGLALALLAGAAAGAVKRYTPPTPEQIEAELLEWINRERTLLGKGNLEPHPGLQEIARQHSAKMAEMGELSHCFPGWPLPEQKLHERNVCFLAQAENVARGENPHARFIHEALMESFRHRLNILDERMRHVGIGVIRSGDDVYVTQEFAAIIPCPVPEAVQIQVENELCRWHREAFGSTPGVLPERRLMARVYAQQSLQGNPMGFKPSDARPMRVVTVCFNSLEQILAVLKKDLLQTPSAALAVGVVWGRRVGFPGGAYAVALLLFP